MNIDYLYSIFDLYLHNEKSDKKTNFCLTKKEDTIECSFNMVSDDSEKTEFSLPYEDVMKQLGNILYRFKEDIMIIDEKYNVNNANNTCFYHVLFQNGRTLTFDGFSMVELNNIRNVLYGININKEELRVNSVNEEKEMVYKPKLRLQQAGFTSYVTLFLVALFLVDILVIALWIFKVISK